MNTLSEMKFKSTFPGKRVIPVLFINLIFLGIMLGFSSCFSSKPIPYFQGGLDTTLVQDVIIPDQRIQKGDILSIVIYSDNVAATAIFNQAAGGEFLLLLHKEHREMHPQCLEIPVDTWLTITEISVYMPLACCRLKG